MFFKAYFSSRDAAIDFTRKHSSSGLDNDGNWFVVTDDAHAAFNMGAYCVVPILNTPDTITIRVVPEASAAEAKRCDELGIPYTGPVLETIQGQATQMDITPADVGMEPLF